MRGDDPERTWIMPKRTTALVAAAAVLLLTLTGCAGTPDAATEPANEAKSLSAPLATESEAPAEPEEPAIGYGPTGAGEVCDPQNANDSLCAAFYPDQAVLRIAARGGAIASLEPQQTISLAAQACDEMRAGSTWEASTLAVGDDNRVLYAAAAVGYCPEYAPGGGDYPDRTSRLITFYQSLGEAGAKEHFADKIMPTEAELGY